MTTSTNNPNAEALVIAFQKRDDQDADWRKKIAPTVEALEKSAANGGFNWDGNVFTSIKKWVPVAFNITYRAWRYRVTGGNPVSKRTKKEGVKPVSPNRVLELKDGTTFKHDGGLFQIDGDISVRKSGGALVFTLIGKPTTPAKKAKKEAKAKRLTPRQTYIAINAVRKQVGKDDRTIEWAQRQYDGILALNGAEKKPHYSAYRTALKHAEETLQGRIQHKETEERMAKLTHLASDEEGSEHYSRCARRNMRLTTDIDAVECDECREAYERQKKYDALRPVHAEHHQDEWRESLKMMKVIAYKGVIKPSLLRLAPVPRWMEDGYRKRLPRKVNRRPYEENHQAYGAALGHHRGTLHTYAGEKDEGENR